MSPITEFEPSNGGFSFEELGEFDTLSVAGSCFPSFPTACIFLWRLRMVKLEEHLKEIKETQRQISKTNSDKRKKDLRKHLSRLWKEYDIAKKNIGRLNAEY
jgi:hypothetical protein